MKMNCWLTLGVMMVTSAVAQDNTTAVPQMPAPTAPASVEVAPAATALETNAPAVTKKSVKHKKHKVAATEKKTEKVTSTEPTAMLVTGPAEVIVSNVNVRGQAGLRGEVVVHLVKGDVVTVLSQINLNKHKADEPGQWAKIALPSSAHVWLRTSYIDETNKTVLPKKLNLRAGPGENYSVLGVIERGTLVNEVKTKGDWMEIDAPTNAYAFVAAAYLKQEAPAATPVVEAPAMPVVAAEPPAPLVEQAPPPLPPRVVTHEGVVRHVISLAAPTEYELFDPTTKQNIDYLYSTSKDLNLKNYKGRRIIVTGEEGLDERWNNTPVLTIQSIQVAE
jgi:uncharacterized protein YgiM (DUF1202 family)